VVVVVVRECRMEGTSLRLRRSTSRRRGSG